MLDCKRNNRNQSEVPWRDTPLPNLGRRIVDDTFHYPPDLFNLLVDTIPRLVRTKRDVLLLFRGAGISDAVLDDLWTAVRSTPAEISKFAMARTVLERLNRAADGAIRERRELLRRVVEFENFAACYDNERDAARARVSDVRSLVNTKDSFTRMALEREHEAEARRHEHRERVEREAKRRSDLDHARARLTGLFAESNPYRRAKAFESVLNDLFSASGILVRESFALADDAGTAEEQIDGAIEVDGRLFLVEAKWLSTPVDVDAVSRHLVRTFGRPETGALLVSASGYTPAAVAECRRALRDRIVVLIELREIVLALEEDRAIGDLLRKRIEVAVLDRKPLAAG